MTRIFISHSTKDADFVRSQLNPLLQQAGSATWCSSTDIQVASDWQVQIRQALAKTDWFIVVLSPDAEQSEWVRAETHWALEHLKGRVIPVMARTCEPGDVHLRLATIQYIDFRSIPDRAARQLLALVTKAPDGDATQLRRGASSSPLEQTVLLRPQAQAILSLEIGAPDNPPYRTQLAIKHWGIIGRSDEADLRIPDPCISRKHARFNLVVGEQDVAVTLADLGSANGTYVNHERILSVQAINPGDLIEIGNARIRVLGIS